MKNINKQEELVSSMERIGKIFNLTIQEIQ